MDIVGFKEMALMNKFKLWQTAASIIVFLVLVFGFGKMIFPEYSAATGIEEEYKKTGELGPCKLDSNDLFDLVNVMVAGVSLSPNFDEQFSPFAPVYISATLSNSTISGNSIADILKSKTLPGKLDNLSIDINGDDQDIELSFFRSHVTLTVRGLSETWVLGKYNQIYNFLKEKRPWYWILSRYFLLIVLFIAVVSSIGIVFFLKKEPTDSLIFLILWVVMFISLAANLPGILFRNQIIIQPTQSFLSKENLTVGINILALISSIILPLVFRTKKM